VRDTVFDDGNDLMAAGFLIVAGLLNGNHRGHIHMEYMSKDAPICRIYFALLQVVQL